MPYPVESESVQRLGYQSVSPSFKRAIQMISRGRRITGTTQILEPALDLVWAKANNRKVANSYFDYYFSGQDVRVFVDGVEDGPDSDLSIMDFAFSIQQQKQPLYGFWNYTYKHMLRGTRIVSGQFRLATTTTDAMDIVITKSAAARLGKTVSGISAPLSEDEKLVEKYWHSTIDESRGAANRNKFASHPPFSFILVYGLQSVSINESTVDHNKELLDRYRDDLLPLHTDTNERLVVADPEAMRYIIEDVELTNMQVEFSPDGNVCSEVYSFLAKDMYIP